MAKPIEVATEEIDRLGHELRVLVAKHFGDCAEQIVTSRHAGIYRDIAREFLKKAHIRPPKKIVRGRLTVVAGDGASVLPYWYIEPHHGAADLDLSTFGKAGEEVELIQVEPER